MTAQLLERVETATTWIEAPTNERSADRVMAGGPVSISQPFAADDRFVTFVLFGTTAGHPRTLIGSFDDRCLYWHGSRAKVGARLYRVPSIAGHGVENTDARKRELRSPADSIKALRELTGLTWEQIGRLFGVSRRAVHLWAAGGKLSAANEELLAEVIDLIRSIDVKSPEEVRHELLAMRPETGMSVYDELRSRHSSSATDINRPAGSAY